MAKIIYGPELEEKQTDGNLWKFCKLHFINWLVWVHVCVWCKLLLVQYLGFRPPIVFMGWLGICNSYTKIDGDISWEGCLEINPWL